MAMKRDYEAERRERDSFILLQHVYTIAEGRTAEQVSVWRLGEDLCFGTLEAGELIDHLARVGYLKRGVGPVLHITLEGIDYIERLAWRRHSVRGPEPSPPPPGGVTGA